MVYIGPDIAGVRTKTEPRDVLTPWTKSVHRHVDATLNSGALQTMRNKAG